MDDHQAPTPEAPDNDTIKDGETAAVGNPKPVQYQHLPYTRTPEFRKPYPQQPYGQGSYQAPAVPGSVPPPNQFQSDGGNPARQPNGNQSAPGDYPAPGVNQAPGTPPPYQYPGGYQQPYQYPLQTYAYPPRAPYYQTPYPAAYPMYGRTQNTGKATASLVLGIVSIVFAWLSILSVIAIPCGVVGLILGIMARRELPPDNGRGTATAGMICSIIGIAIAVLMLIFVIVLYSTILSFGSYFGPSYGV